MALEDESPRLHVNKDVDNDTQDKKNEENDARCEPVPEVASTTEWSPAGHQVKSQQSRRGYESENETKYHFRDGHFLSMPQVVSDGNVPY